MRRRHFCVYVCERLVAGRQGFELGARPVSNVVMVRDFWFKDLDRRPLTCSVSFTAVHPNPPDSAPVVETFWLAGRETWFARVRLVKQGGHDRRRRTAAGPRGLRSIRIGTLPLHQRPGSRPPARLDTRDWRPPCLPWQSPWPL